MGDVHQPKTRGMIVAPVHDDTNHSRVELFDTLQQRQPVHAWHAHMRDQDVGRIAPEPFERFTRVGQQSDLEKRVFIGQGTLQAMQAPELIVDEQEFHGEPSLSVITVWIYVLWLRTLSRLRAPMCDCTNPVLQFDCNYLGCNAWRFTKGTAKPAPSPRLPLGRA